MNNNRVKNITMMKHNSTNSAATLKIALPNTMTKILSTTTSKKREMSDGILPSPKSVQSPNTSRRKVKAID